MPDLNDVYPWHLYQIEGRDLQRVASIAKRLYSEERMSGDDMRNAAQALHSAVQSAFVIKPEGGPSGKGKDESASKDDTA